MLDKLLNFIVRGLIGLFVIYLVNEFGLTSVPVYTIGLNAISFVTSGFLGVPGVIALYGINFFLQL